MVYYVEKRDGASFGFRPNIRSIDRTYRSVASLPALAKESQRGRIDGSFWKRSVRSLRVVLYVDKCRGRQERESSAARARRSNFAVRHGAHAWCGMARHSAAWRGTLRYGAAQHGRRWSVKRWYVENIRGWNLKGSSSLSDVSLADNISRNNFLV